MLTVRRSVALLCLAVLLPGASFAQGPTPAPSSSVPSVAVVRLMEDEAIQLDGVLDDPAWQRVAPATGFLQRDPDNGALATEQTEVRLLYDANRLILGVICHDSEPERVLGNQMQRDAELDTDDSFSWTLDTFRDGRSGYFFEVNPSGAMGDGLIGVSLGFGNDFGAGINRSWDGIWLARVRRSAVGWTAEVEIPFRTLNFDPNASVWGGNFQRNVRRKNEESLWTGYARNQGLARMSNAGQLSGISGLSQGLGLDLKPYVVGSVSSAPGRGRPDAFSTGDVGFDAFYNVTPALRANLSVNTDFAETEVDQRRVNLTRFPLFFEEKRDFFLEGSSFFDFSREPGRSLVPFFSRRIGLDARGTPQRIDVGAKLTGQAGAFDVGVLQVRTAEDAGVLGEDFSVLRARRRVFQQSYVGGLYTRRSTRSAAAIDRHTAGLDFELKTSAFRQEQNVELSGFYLVTSAPGPTRETAAYGLRFAYPNDPFSAEVAVREVQANYDPALGFVDRRGYKQLAPSAEYSLRFRDHPWLRSLGWEVELDVQNDPRNRPLTRELGFSPLSVSFEDGSGFELDVTRQYERLEEDFKISDGIVLPVGAVYRFTRYGIRGRTADHRVVALEGNTEVGDFFSGRAREHSVEMSVRPRRGMALSVEAEHNVLHLAQGSFDANVFRTGVSTQFSPFVSVASDLQYDTVSRLLGWQMRFRWIHRPGNDLYFVYTHNWRELLLDPADRRRLATLDNRLATKLVYTIGF